MRFKAWGVAKQPEWMRIAAVPVVSSQWAHHAARVAVAIARLWAAVVAALVVVAEALLVLAGAAGAVVVEAAEAVVAVAADRDRPVF